jgi:addiction module RelE/StbE family toxin
LDCLVENEGIAEARNGARYRDEALQGQLKGKRSIRLSKKWRAIYSVDTIKNKSHLIVVEKVSPHEYKK